MQVSQQYRGDGLITNDKFCVVRRARLQLSWSRLPWSLRVTRDTEGESRESLPQGGSDATSVDRAPQHTTRSGRPAPMGSCLSAATGLDHPPTHRGGAREAAVVTASVTGGEP